MKQHWDGTNILLAGIMASLLLGFILGKYWGDQVLIAATEGVVIEYDQR